MERNISEAIILNKNNEILLQKKTIDYPHAPGKWCFFGGEILKNETPEETIKRELKEELGINFNSIKLFKKIDYSISEEISGKSHIFIISFDNSIKDISLGEGAGFAFFNFSEINSLNTARWTEKIINSYLLS